ncbi:hypothetical protein Golob_005496 [Gossypium lobatum]|uniref:DUF4283 domain-containing protein n=1 Tax=Gossypium lobatum TaxID=34289 RepID=A0A7J8MTC4_9ROSI|nr:hypothetical protein [Gossypium lobatum]
MTVALFTHGENASPDAHYVATKCFPRGALCLRGNKASFYVDEPCHHRSCRSLLKTLDLRVGKRRMTMISRRKEAKLPSAGGRLLGESKIKELIMMLESFGLIMEDDVVGLKIDDGEEKVWAVEEELKEEESQQAFCLVGCFFTASMVHFSTMTNTLANLWHPIGEMVITILWEKRFMFKFYHEVDIYRVINDAPWTFNNHMLVFRRPLVNEDPVEVPLIYSFFWVQIHDLSSGMMSEAVAKQLARVIKTI